MRYVIFRYGSNAANQPMNQGPVLVARVEAETEAGAIYLARQRVTLYNNQYLTASDEAAYDAEQRVIDAAVEVTDN